MPERHAYFIKADLTEIVVVVDGENIEQAIEVAKSQFDDDSDGKKDYTIESVEHLGEAIEA